MYYYPMPVKRPKPKSWWHGFLTLAYIQILQSNQTLSSPPQLLSQLRRQHLLSPLTTAWTASTTWVWSKRLTSGTPSPRLPGRSSSKTTRRQQQLQQLPIQLPQLPPTLLFWRTNLPCCQLLSESTLSGGNRWPCPGFQQVCFFFHQKIYKISFTSFVSPKLFTFFGWVKNCRFFCVITKWISSPN